MSCHFLWHRKTGGKKPQNPLWIQNSSLSVSFAGMRTFGEQQVFRYCVHTLGAVGQWGTGGGERARVTQPCSPHPRCIVTDRLGKGSFPASSPLQWTNNAITTPWKVWLLLYGPAAKRCAPESDKLLHASAGQRDTLSVDVTAAVAQYELVHAAKRFCTNICILLILLYPKTWLLFFPNASQYCLILI